MYFKLLFVFFCISFPFFQVFYKNFVISEWLFRRENFATALPKRCRMTERPKEKLRKTSVQPKASKRLKGFFLISLFRGVLFREYLDVLGVMSWMEENQPERFLWQPWLGTHAFLLAPENNNCFWWALKTFFVGSLPYG